jgi:hypothetical protein
MPIATAARASAPIARTGAEDRFVAFASCIMIVSRVRNSAERPRTPPKGNKRRRPTIGHAARPGRGEIGET